MKASNWKARFLLSRTLPSLVINKTSSSQLIKDHIDAELGGIVWKTYRGLKTRYHHRLKRCDIAITKGLERRENVDKGLERKDTAIGERA